MFNQDDIKLIQKNRPKLDDDQCGEVLSFLMDMNERESIPITDIENTFKQAADIVFGEVKE